MLHTLKFTLFAVGYLIIVSIPFALGEYPVVEVGSALKSDMILSVVAVPVAVVVTTVAHTLPKKSRMYQEPMYHSQSFA